MREKPLKSNMPQEQGPKVLTFKEFSSLSQLGMFRYNNFWVYFNRGSGWVGDIYRQTEHYKKFFLEHPDLVSSLSEKIENRDVTLGLAGSLQSLNRELYEAYKIMRSYGTSDEELFM